MSEFLEGKRLKTDLLKLIQVSGPRPAGHPAEAKAREYIESTLREHGISEIERLDYQTPDTWGWGTIVPVLIALIAMIFVPNPLVSSLVSLFAASQFVLTLHGKLHDHLLYRFYPKRPSASLFVRIPAKKAMKRRVVLLGHIDTNKARLSFSPRLKKFLRLASTGVVLSMLLYALASLLAWDWLRYLTIFYLGTSLISFVLDEKAAYVEGANDNGSALACLLGIGRQANMSGFEHTEICLAFTGEEEVSHNGLKAILKQHGDGLKDAQFIDFEMVGKGNIYFASQQSGLIAFTSYSPDPASLALAEATARRIRSHQISGRSIPILDEVFTLRRSGFRAICLVGIDEDGYPANWHQGSDTLANIDEQSLETAAIFAWEMILDIESAVVAYSERAEAKQ